MNENVVNDLDESLQEFVETLEYLGLEEPEVYSDGSGEGDVGVSFITYGDLESLRPLTLLIDTDAHLTADAFGGRYRRVELTFSRHVDGPLSVFQMEMPMEVVESLLHLAEVFLRAARPDLFAEESVTDNEAIEAAGDRMDEGELDDDAMFEEERAPLDVDAGGRALYQMILNHYKVNFGDRGGIGADRP